MPARPSRAGEAQNKRPHTAISASCRLRNGRGEGGGWGGVGLFAFPSDSDRVNF